MRRSSRVKLASELGKSATGHTLYVLNRLADLGRTILIIEHNLDVIKCAGGQIVAAGAPERIVQAAGSHTAEHLKPKLAQRSGLLTSAAVA